MGAKDDHSKSVKAAQHQQALAALTVFVACMSEQMQIGRQHQVDCQQPGVSQAFAEVSGETVKLDLWQFV